MNLDQKTTQKIQELQLTEQNLQNFSLQKQSIQVEINEIVNALTEISKTKDDVFRVLGGIMIKANKEDLKKELEDKQKVLEIRINSFDKQEKMLEEKSQKLREELNEAMKNIPINQ
ncbi:prefoldin subunit beta [Candidatus Pacearchaeota archaeon CG10_big_fil_rev_8_21_14_0_10_31_24]|nr:MAG: prefoldin subunit beta [Candidatus Pacearchaeota archaeon CG10_big_fil_rev_8_21_14_0_10_31_24]